MNQATVVKWRKRYLEGGLDGLVDEPRPGAPRTISDDDVERVVVKTLEETPTDATHWSTRDLAKRVGMSPSSVGRIWRAFGLKPWLTDTFKLSDDPQFIDKVRDVVGLYLNPPDHAVVLCVDEKTGIQALDRTRPSLPMRPGQVERRTHDYVRHGVIDLFAALNVATGEVISRFDKQHRAVEFIKFLDLIDASVPADLAVHVIVGQRLDPQDPGGEEMAAAPPPLRVALHADQLELAEPRGTLVRRAHQPQAPPLRPPLHPSAHRRPHRLGRALEHRPQALRLAQDRRRDPRQPQEILDEPLTQDTRRPFAKGLLSRDRLARTLACHFRATFDSACRRSPSVRVANVDARAVRHPNETVDAVSRQRDLRIRCTGADGAGAALASMSPSAAAIAWSRSLVACW